MAQDVYRIRIKELAARGPEAIPDEFRPNCHLIYSSPETLAYNSPGALGFGVKRAGLLIPESVMLLVSPACCGRNSTILSQEEGYAERMFYLLMDETDLVTGRHLRKIPEAIREIVRVADPAPKVVVICITCADALLGTDLERVCRKAEQETGVRVVPSYMYALEREGRKPPMTAIRQTIYSLLERKAVDPRAVNLMGFFTPLSRDSELPRLLRGMGIRTIHQVSEKSTLASYAEMGAANFNLVLHPEARFAAEDLKNRLGIPYIELPRLFDLERIHRQYHLLAAALEKKVDDAADYEAALRDREAFSAAYRGMTVSIGEQTNANPYELAAALTACGLTVRNIFANLTEDDFPYVNRLASVSPDTTVYTGIEPSMIHYQDEGRTDVAVGKDAAGYCPSAKRLEWYSEEQPYGFAGVRDFFRAFRAAADGEVRS